VTCPIADLRRLANQFSRPAAGEGATQQALVAILSRLKLHFCSGLFDNRVSTIEKPVRFWNHACAGL